MIACNAQRGENATRCQELPKCHWHLLSTKLGLFCKVACLYYVYNDLLAIHIGSIIWETSFGALQLRNSTQAQTTTTSQSNAKSLFSLFATLQPAICADVPCPLPLKLPHSQCNITISVQPLHATSDAETRTHTSAFPWNAVYRTMQIISLSSEELSVDFYHIWVS